MDATRAALLDVGVRRTTFAEVARRADMSRATLYTHFPDAGTAIAAVLTRELGAVLAASRAMVGPTARARLVDTLRGAVARLQDHPLLQRVMAEDADLLLPYVMVRFGEVQRLALDMLVGLIIDGQADGSIRPGRATTIATSILVAVQSLVLSQRVPHVDEETVAVLLEIVDQGLAPEGQGPSRPRRGLG